MNAASPGELLRETKRSASYLVRSPLDLEGKRRKNCPGCQYVPSVCGIYVVTRLVLMFDLLCT